MSDEDQKPPPPSDPPATLPEDSSRVCGRKNPDPGPAFRAVFTDPLKIAIVEAVKRAYRIVQEHHLPELGYNAQTFGHNVYHIGCYQLGELCKRVPGQLARVEELRMLARFQSGEYTLGFYKVGSSASEDIWSSFPTSENGAMSVNEAGQPILLGLEDAMLDRVEDLRYAVVAHLGNSERGLCAVYLCIPIETAGGKILRWGYAEPLYIANSSTGTPAPAPAAPPPEEVIAAPLPAEEPEGDVIVRPKEGG